MSCCKYRVIDTSANTVRMLSFTLLLVGRFHPFHRPRRSLGGVEVSLYSVFDLGTRRGWGVSVTPRPFSTPGKDPVPVVQEVGWIPGPVWTGAENLASTGIRSPDRPARSQSLYRLRYWAHYFAAINVKIFWYLVIFLACWKVKVKWLLQFFCTNGNYVLKISRF
jgi:hypothetical protein